MCYDEFPVDPEEYLRIKNCFKLFERVINNVFGPGNVGEINEFIIGLEICHFVDRYQYESLADFS